MSGLTGIRSVTCILAVICAAAYGQAERDPVGPPRMEVETLQQWETARRDSAPAWSVDGAALSTRRLLPTEVARSAFADVGLRARWWWVRGAVEVGGGADWTAPSAAATTPGKWSPVVGVRADLSERTRLVYESEHALPWRGTDNSGAVPRTTRVALEFKSKSPVGDLRNGLLRVQLSGDAALQFKPRGGGLQVMYRERF